MVLVIVVVVWKEISIRVKNSRLCFFFYSFLFLFLFLFISYFRLVFRRWHDIFLSLILPSWMIIPNRQLANTYFPFIFSLFSNLQIYNNIIIDIDINTLRDWSINSSTNNSRESSTYSSILLITYAKRVQALNNSSSCQNCKE